MVSVIGNFVSSVAEEITQSVDQVKMRLISQLIKDISELLMHFNGTAILTSFVLSTAGVFPVIFILNLNDPEFVKISFGTPL